MVGRAGALRTVRHFGAVKLEESLNLSSAGGKPAAHRASLAGGSDKPRSLLALKPEGLGLDPRPRPRAHQGPDPRPHPRAEPDPDPDPRPHRSQQSPEPRRPRAEQMLPSATPVHMAARRDGPTPNTQRSSPPSLVRFVRSLIPILPCATVSTALLGWIFFYLTCRYKVLDPHTFTLGNFQSRLQVYKLLSYVFIHKSMSALVCNVIMLWYFGGAMEKDIGTVKYAYLTLLFSILTGIIYTSISSIFFELQKLKEIQGFTVVVFAYVGMAVFLSPMKNIVFITNIKMAYLPFVLLVLALFVPESSVFGNVCGIAAGVIYAYGRKYFPYLDLHELTAASLERYFPFDRLKQIPGITFYASLWEVRNVEVTNRWFARWD
uniref:rhomboid domain-containing protein 2 isoform X2 n=1 Tax=Pristiophorus japonicus TaxID=55135 RepID=UPI00398F6C8E